MHFKTLVSTALCATLALGAALPGGLDLPTETEKKTSEWEATPTPTPTGTKEMPPPPPPVGPCGQIDPKYAAMVRSQFITDGIIPDLIENNTFNPLVQVNVAYGNKVDNLGTYYITTETINAPTFNFSGEKDFDPFKTKYIYFLIDPDVPQDGSMVQVNFNHWTVADAQPFCVPNQDPKTIVIYEPLTPASTTQHRYTFLVYRQPPGFDPADNLIQTALLNIRTPFDINDFAEANGLVNVGGNFLKEAIVNGVQNGLGVTGTAVPGGTPTGS